MLFRSVKRNNLPSIIMRDHSCGLGFGSNTCEKFGSIEDVEQKPVHRRHGVKRRDIRQNDLDLSNFESSEASFAEGTGAVADEGRYGGVGDVVVF